MSQNEEEPYKLLSQKDNDDTETCTKQRKAILNDYFLNAQFVLMSVPQAPFTQDRGDFKPG